MNERGAIGYTDDTCKVVVQDSKIWRDGPASHIYDQLGVPQTEDCDYLDYSWVLQRQEQPWESPHTEAENERQLELAVSSILPETENKDDPNVQNCGVSDHSIYPNTHQNSPLPVVLSTRKKFYDDSGEGRISQDLTVPDGRLQDINDNHRLKMLMSQLEQDNAVAVLLQEMDFEEEDTSQDDPQCMSEEDKMINAENGNYSLVTQISWENEVVWDVPTTSIKSVNDGPIPKGKHARAGWVPCYTARTASITTQPDPKSFKSLLSYENEELLQGSWEDEIIWDAEDFLSRYHQPKLPVFDTADEDIIFEMPKDIPTEHETSDQLQPIVQPKKNQVQPHTMKSKLILGKTGFIHWKWKKEQLEQEARELQAKSHESHSSTNISTLKPKSAWIANLNISNDEFYQPKDASPVELYNCRHSRLIKQLVSPFIFTHLSVDQLREFHRPRLSATVNAPLAAGPDPNRHYFKSLLKRVKTKEIERRDLMAEGNLILFDQPIDLSARDGTVILIEYCEEYPPLLSQVGMCSRIINFYKRKSLKEEEFGPPLPHCYGETSFVSNSSGFPFLGTLDYGQVLSAIGNNMYHAPIYWQGGGDRMITDFLLIRTKNTGYMLRYIDGVFVAGQQSPLIEVPEPNSNKVKNFLREFLQAFVYHKYRACLTATVTDASSITTPGSVPPKIRMDVITQHFPSLPETTIKSILKNSSELKRIGNVSWMVMKAGFTIPSEEDQDKFIAEQICAYYSLLAAEQRLKDAGFNSMLALPERGHDDGDGKKLRKINPNCLLVDPSGKFQGQSQNAQSAYYEELLSAPWNTTAAFIAASKGKCILQVTGPADPTGCGEGYSYVRVAKRSQVAGAPDVSFHQNSRGQSKKCPTRTGGTDADLRKLSSKTAKDLLRKVGVPDNEIKKLSRWEIIDLVRTLSTEKMIQGETIDKTVAKFSRWKSFHSIAMNQERFREACQRVFELQTKVLSSTEILSTDECDTDDDEPSGRGTGETQRMGATKRDIERMGKNIERILYGDTDIDRMTHEEEELERLELQKMMLGGIRAKDADIAKRKETLEKEKELAQKSKENSEDILTDLLKHPNKVLKFTRTFKENGVSFVRTEIVRDPVVIAAYLRIRNSKSEEFIRHFLDNAERREKKEQKQKDRLRFGKLQGLAQKEERRVAKIYVKRKREMEDEYFPNKGAKIEAEKEMRRQRRKCGACGMPGHMKTSKECPMYNQEKIDRLIKKLEMKKQQKIKVAVPDQQNTADLTLQQPTAQLSQASASNDLSYSTDSDDSSDESGDSSSDEDGYSSSENDSDEVIGLEQSQQSTLSNVSSTDGPTVQTEGLKMIVRGCQELVTQAQVQEAKEQEVARILAAMAMENQSQNSNSSSTSKRRVSQSERENADYLNVRKYKTTAADRRSLKF